MREISETKLLTTKAEGNRHFFLELTDVAEREPTQRPKHSTALPQQRHGSQVNRESSPVTTVPSTKHLSPPSR